MMFISAKCRSGLPQFGSVCRWLLKATMVFILFFTGTGASTLPQPGVGAFFLNNLTRHKDLAKPIIFYASMNTVMQYKGEAAMQTMHFAGAGFASHLGNSLIEVHTVFSPDSKPGQLKGTATFTAASGEEFYTSFTGTTVHEDGKCKVHFVHSITGGTGRMNDINGLLRGDCVHDNQSKKGTISLEGEIDY